MILEKMHSSTGTMGKSRAAGGRQQRHLNIIAATMNDLLGKKLSDSTKKLSDSIIKYIY